MSTTVTLVRDEVFREHDMPGHPESARRLIAIDEAVQADELLRTLPRTPPAAVDPELLRAVHTDEHVRNVERVARSGGGWIDGDTYCTARSYEVALLAAGGAVAGVDAVCGGAARTAFALLRPPGHHATPSRAMGFCLFNNAAVAVRAAQRRHGLERVAVVDIDVHHGNGTQDVFSDDPSVLYCSLHQWPLYPGTGGAAETGEGRGEGFTVNVPLPPGTAGEGWLEAFEEHVVPAVDRFRPQLLVVSAGYDAHQDDPLAQLRLSTGTYARTARRLRDLAAEHAGGRMLWVLEGGYDLEALGASVTASLRVLAGLEEAA